MYSSTSTDVAVSFGIPPADVGMKPSPNKSKSLEVDPSETFSHSKNCTFKFSYLSAAIDSSGQVSGVACKDYPSSKYVGSS